MTAIVGRQPTFAFKLATTWGTAETVGAGDGVLPLSDGLLAGHAIEKHHDESLPLNFVQKTNEGIETIAGDIVKNLRYQGDELFLALAMGDPQTKTGAGPEYTMEIYLATVLAGLFGTWVTNLTAAEVAEVPSVKINGFSLSGEMGSPLQLTLKAIGNILRRTGDTGMVNTISDLANVTVADAVKNNRVVMNHRTELLINAESGAALASPTDVLGIQGFSFDFLRGMETYAQSDSVADDSVCYAEPVDNDFPKPTLSLTIPRYDAQEDFLDNLKEGDTYKAKFTFEGDLIPATAVRYKFQMWFPRLHVMSIAPAVSGPGKVPGDVTFVCEQVESVPSGFTDDKPFSLLTVNQAAAAPF